MTSTVLMVTRPRTGAVFNVIMDNSPAVFTLKDVQYFYPLANNSIEEGSRIMLHTTGRWNVYTSSMHGAKISIWHDKNKTGMSDNKPDNNPPATVEPATVKPVAVEPYKAAVCEPARRKRRVAMDF